MTTIKTTELVVAIAHCPEARRHPLMAKHDKTTLIASRDGQMSQLRDLLRWKDQAVKQHEILSKPAAEAGGPLPLALERLYREFELHLGEAITALETFEMPQG